MKSENKKDIAVFGALFLPTEVVWSGGVGQGNISFGWQGASNQVVRGTPAVVRVCADGERDICAMKKDAMEKFIAKSGLAPQVLDGDVLPPDPMRGRPCSKILPGDALLADELRKSFGVVGHVALILGVDKTTLQEHIARNPILEEAMKDGEQLSKDRGEHHLRARIAEGDLGAMAIRTQQMKAKEARGGGVGKGDREPIDFTKEVGTVEDLSDEEMRARIRHESYAWNNDCGLPCPCCGWKPEIIKAVEVIE